VKTSHNTTAASNTARQILDGEFDLMGRNQLDELWQQMCCHFRAPGCPQAFAYLQTWLKKWNVKTYGSH
jgi:hypothetical protein